MALTLLLDEKRIALSARNIDGAESLLCNKYDEVIELLVSLTTEGRATGGSFRTTYNARADEAASK